MNRPLSSCDQCGRSINRADNLQNYKRNCTGRGVIVPTVAVPAAKNVALVLLLKDYSLNCKRLTKHCMRGQCLNLCPLMDFVFSSRIRLLR